MITLNAAHFSASKPSSSVARIRWPVEETGRNSVTPSTMPRMIAIRRIGTSVGRRQVDPPAGELAAAMEAAEPLMPYRGKRRRIDAERLEAGVLAGGHIVPLKHQPLIPRQRRTGQPAEAGQQAAERVGKRKEVGVLTGELQDCPVQVDHAHHLGAADLVRAPAVLVGVE